MPEGLRVCRASQRPLAALLAVALAGCAVQTAPSPTRALPSPSATRVALSSPPPRLGPGDSPTPTPLIVPPPPGVPADPQTHGSRFLRSEPPRAALQARLEKLVAYYGIPGVSVTILWPGGYEWTGVAGVTDVATGQKLSTDTGFALGSISKTYTAANTLKLVEEGFLRLDDSAARYLPALKLDPLITIRMLLEHTSGLPDYFLDGSIDRSLQARPDATWSTKQTLRYVRKALFPPGRRWVYSNTNYLLLGMIDEVVDGRPLAFQIRARFLDPLDLDQTWTQVVEQPRAGTARGHQLFGRPRARTAWPVYDGGAVMPFRSVVTAAGGAGDMAATSIDAARWLEDLVLGNVLRAQTRDEMLREALYTDAIGARIPYGLGIQVGQLGDRPAIGHTGRLLGFRAIVRVLPVERMTIAVLTNQSTLDPTLIAKSLLRLALPRVSDCGVCPTIL